MRHRVAEGFKFRVRSLQLSGTLPDSHFQIGFQFGHLAVERGILEMDILEPNPRGLMQPIPVGQTIVLRSAGRDTPISIDGQDRFTVVDRTLGRVALRTGTNYVSVSRTSDSTSTVGLRAGAPGERETFQWMETLYGDIVLMSLATNRYLFLEPGGRVTASSRGPEPDPNDGTAFRWRIAQ